MHTKNEDGRFFGDVDRLLLLSREFLFISSSSLSSRSFVMCEFIVARPLVDGILHIEAESLPTVDGLQHTHEPLARYVRTLSEKGKEIKLFYGKRWQLNFGGKKLQRRKM